MVKLRTLTGIVCLLAAMATAQEKNVPKVEPKNQPKTQELSTATYYVKELERTASQSNGKPFSLGGDAAAKAMRLVKELVQKYPENEKVKDLFARVRVCVKKSRGAYFEVTEEILAYRKLEQLVREKVGEMADKAWDEYMVSFKKSARYFPSAFPAPDPGLGDSLKNMFFKRVILKKFNYFSHEFTNNGKQYVYIGGPTEGYYFIELSNRRWLGAYEALRRYRRTAAGQLPGEWIITGTITGSDILVPRTGAKTASDVARFGWIVQPESIYIPGRMLARPDRGHPRGGFWVGEEKLDEIKAPYLTHKEVPDDVKPDKLLEIYAAAVKEKNFPLFIKCIDPLRRVTPLAEERLRGFWDVNQQQFALNYVHVEPIRVSAPIVLKGERLGKEDLDTFFLDDDDKKKIQDRSDDLVEEIYVTYRRFDEKGKQVGTPPNIVLRRYKGGRWFVFGGFVL